MTKPQSDPEDLRHGIITKCIAGEYSVYIDGVIITAAARGKFRSDGIVPVTGDRVVVSGREGSFVIKDVLERRNILPRPAVANIEVLIITLSPCRPEPDLMLADLLVAYCRRQDIMPVICVNKRDLSPEAAVEICGQYVKSNLTALSMSALLDQDVVSLFGIIKGRITCLAGQSAAGKSTLINRLMPGVGLKTGQLSKKTDRGRHTTRYTELLIDDSGVMLIDTPGFSLLELMSVPPEEFTALYYEYGEYSPGCRYRGCAHIGEPGCAVEAAAEKNILSAERYERYRRLYADIKDNWRKRYD